MKEECEVIALREKIQELETENAALRAELRRLKGSAGDVSASASGTETRPTPCEPTQLMLALPDETPAAPAPPDPAQRTVPSVCHTSSPEDKIRLFRSLFRGREDVYALRWHSDRSQKSGYSPVCGNEWAPGLCEKGRVPCAKCPHRTLLPLNDTVLYRHLAGKDALARDVVGLYPMLADETCFLLALDFDDANWQDCARAVSSVCREKDIPFALERSRSGQGAHLWIFFADAVPCVKARRLGDALLTAAMAQYDGLQMTAYDRMFPNQDTLPVGGFGHLIALPLQGQARRQGNSVFLDEQMRPYPD